MALLKQVARVYPGQELHLIADNYATPKTPEVKAWLAENPRIAVHFTLTSAFWLNLVEVWLGVIQRQAIGRVVFTSVTDLTTKIRSFINGWNTRATPFVWTKTPEKILKKATRKTTSNTNHQKVVSHRGVAKLRLADRISAQVGGCCARSGGAAVLCVRVEPGHGRQRLERTLTTPLDV